jgi:hypothetical protein
MGITAFMAIFPLVTKIQVGLNEYADFFAKTASVYTGIIGVIIGYYFGRAHDLPVGAGAEPRSSSGSFAPPETIVPASQTPTGRG